LFKLTEQVFMEHEVKGSKLIEEQHAERL